MIKMVKQDFVSELKRQLFEIKIETQLNRRMLEGYISMGAEELVSNKRKQQYYHLVNLCDSYRYVIAYNSEPGQYKDGKYDNPK